MDRHTEKRRSQVLVDAKKRGGASFIDENAHFCTRTGCSGRIKYASNSNIRNYYHSSASTSSLSESKGELLEISLPQRSISVATSARKPCRVNQSASPVSCTPSAPSRSSDLQQSNSSSGSGRRLDHRNLKSNSSSGSSGSYSSHGSKSFSNNSKKKSSADAESSSSRVGGKTVSNSTTTISNVRNKKNCASSHGGSDTKVSMNTSTRTRPSHNERSPSYAVVPTTSNSRSYSLPRRCRGSEPATMPSSRTHGAVRFTSTNRDFLRHHYDINGAAEMLLALERIEHDSNMTPEQMLLQIGIFLSNLALHDQHQDMRLDIDSMSYEELLALEERMGSVSTPLSEEELSKCLKRSVYQQTSTPQPEGSSSINLGDTKCSICQEDYTIGETIGVLSKCCHRYHETCISQWLRLKNWCPICKASASTSLPSSL